MTEEKAIGGVYLKVKVVERKWNIVSDEIEAVLNKVIYIAKKYVDDDNIITTYYHETWGSCREWKLLVTDVQGNYLPGEWIDRSSHRNVRKYKVTKISDLPSEVKVYYFESPSCNKSKRFSFLVIADVIKQ